MNTYTLYCEYGCASDTDLLRILKDAKTISKTSNEDCVVRENRTNEVRAIYRNNKKVYFV